MQEVSSGGTSMVMKFTRRNQGDINLAEIKIKAGGEENSNAWNLCCTLDHAYVLSPDKNLEFLMSDRYYLCILHLQYLSNLPCMLHEHDEDANSGVVMVVPIKLGIKVKGRLWA